MSSVFFRYIGADQAPTEEGAQEFLPGISSSNGRRSSGVSSSYTVGADQVPTEEEAQESVILYNVKK